MRLRAARKFISKLAVSFQIRTDWYLYLKERGLWFNYIDQKYRFYIRFKGRTFLATQTCAFRCIKSLFSRISNMSTIQGQAIDVNPVLTPRKQDFVTTLKEIQNPDFPLLSAPNYGTISFLTKVRPHNKVKIAIQEASSLLSVDTLKEADNYVHSSTITDSTLLVPAFNKLASKPIKPINRQLLKRMLLIDILTQKREKGKLITKSLEFSPIKMAEFNKNSGSASGILPVSPVHGLCSKTTGTKGEMFTAAVSCNIRDRITEGIPNSIPFKPFFKSEVLKKGKSVRGIQNESLANYMILAMSQTDETLFHKGIAIGMGAPGRGPQIIFYYWYVIFRKETGKGWVDFIEYLKEHGAHESDKTAWEASTNGTDGFANLFCEVNTKRFATEGDKRLYVRAIADVCNPFIYIDRCGFWAPWRVPSGTYFTSKWNSQRHRLMNLAVVGFIKQHNMRLGAEECQCDVCIHLKTNKIMLGLEVTDLLIKLRAHAFILGDDYIAVSLGIEHDRIFDTIMDYMFGTTTRTEFKQMFESAEFLRKRFKIIDHNIIPYRETSRVVAKLIHGSHRANVEKFSAALYSAFLDMGHNEELNSFIKFLIKQFEPEPEPFLRELQVFGKKNHDVEQILSFVNINMEDVVNYNNRPLETLINVLKTIK